jgi:hypothetical protein
MFLLFLLLFSCSGYRFSQLENPLSQYGIRSLSVPMFYNYSNLSEIHSDFTRETYRLLTEFSGLVLNSGYKTSSDAVLIGIIRSPEKIADTIKPMNIRLAQGRASQAIGSQRQNFNIPGSSDVSLYLQVIVIKKPTPEELVLLKSEMSDKIVPNSRIIFNELLPLRISYTREVLDQEGVQVVATQNQGIQRKTFKNLSEKAAISIRDMILYAF